MRVPLVLGLVVLLSAAASAAAGGGGAGAVRPWVVLRDSGIVKQRLEFSCGMASLATVLNRSYGRTFTEPELISGFVAIQPAERKKRIETVGFSLRDLQQAAAMHKVTCKGYQMTLQGLRDASGPVLLHLVIKGQRHFCVLGALGEREILLLDPARGRVRLPLDRFMKEWTGYCLLFAK